MSRSRDGRRRSMSLRPAGDNLETRQLLNGTWPTYISKAELRSLLNDPPGQPAVRPNTPVLPYGTPAKSATFIDPSVCVTNGYAVIISQNSFIGPYAKLNAQAGIVKIGSYTAILDNASITANPSNLHGGPAPEVLIGSQVEISYGATVTGPAVIGGYNAATKPTYVGPGAVIDGATIAPGAFVSALARVGPGVTVPAGMKVLPGANVTTDAEASDPALGKVTPVTAADQADLVKTLNANYSLGIGYATLYQGQSATGASPGVPSTVSGVFNGNLWTVTGANSQPGSPTASTAYLPPGAGPKFPTPHRPLLAQGLLGGFTSRVTGGARFTQRASNVQAALGRRNSIRADQGQPISVGSIAQTGSSVTINSPEGGSLSIGQQFSAGRGAVILGGTSAKPAVIGDDVTIGAGAVVDRSSLGSGSTVGPLAYVLNSTFPAGTNIPDGAIYINNVLVGHVSR
ncbi:MAG: carbonic anhydrase/acetyltransferase [Paludisphaera borealis]|uniref:carbonic anhydrase/acetyltransferase n=1 Tax=Paludisphaera borealis TaxID=1387353 RepID=UPI0028436DB7|nr:carbonic anhydrase/acetyltransferase [Paludisphaera borealis]MDR3619675.1 carbonic anhydrase/acetyltransferase [Paludisphaera borealis]